MAQARRRAPPSMTDAYRRTFYHLSTTLEARPSKHTKHMKPFVMRDVVQSMLKRQAKAPLNFEPSDHRGLALIDSQELEGGVVLLIAYWDERLADPSMISVGDRTIKSIRPDDGSLWASAAHLCISYNSTPDRQYPAMLEISAHVGRTVVARFLNHLLKHFAYTLSGNRIWPHITFVGEMSAELHAALEAGHFQGVDLIRNVSRDDVGVGEFGLHTTVETLAVRRPRGGVLRKLFDSSKKLPMLEKLLVFGGNNSYDVMRVKLSPSSNPELPQQVDIPIGEQDVGDTLFVKRSSHKFEAKLAAAHPEVVTEIAQHMFDTLKIPEGGS